MSSPKRAQATGIGGDVVADLAGAACVKVDGRQDPAASTAFWATSSTVPARTAIAIAAPSISWMPDSRVRDSVITPGSGCAASGKSGHDALRNDRHAVAVADRQCGGRVRPDPRQAQPLPDAAHRLVARESRVARRAHGFDRRRVGQAPLQRAVDHGTRFRACAMQ